MSEFRERENFCLRTFEMNGPYWHLFTSGKETPQIFKKKEDFGRIACETIQLNGRTLDSNKELLQKMRDTQDLNYSIQQRNEELLAKIKELEAKLNFVIKQRDYYYDLLENAGEMEGMDE